MPSFLNTLLISRHIPTRCSTYISGVGSNPNCPFQAPQREQKFELMRVGCFIPAGLCLGSMPSPLLPLVGCNWVSCCHLCFPVYCPSSILSLCLLPALGTLGKGAGCHCANAPLNPAFEVCWSPDGCLFPDIGTDGKGLGSVSVCPQLGSPPHIKSGKPLYLRKPQYSSRRWSNYALDCFISQVSHITTIRIINRDMFVFVELHRHFITSFSLDL